MLVPTARLLVAALAVVLVAGCGEDQDVQPLTPGSAEAAAPAPGDPVALVGSWRVEAVAGEEPAAVLRLAASDLSLWRDCGRLMGAWRADTGGLFVGAVSGGSAGCVSTASELTPAWLRQATSYGVDGAVRVLLDERGAVVARLLPGGRPTAGPDVAPSEAEPPVVTDQLREAFRPAAPLPAGLEPADRSRLIGRWVPADGAGRSAPQPPFALLAADGGWRGSDGCNGQGGRWVAGVGGSLLAVAGPQTLIGCDGVSVGSWLSSASWAGFDGKVLVLLDEAGQELGRLTPDPG